MKRTLIEDAVFTDGTESNRKGQKRNIQPTKKFGGVQLRSKRGKEGQDEAVRISEHHRDFLKAFDDHSKEYEPQPITSADISSFVDRFPDFKRSLGKCDDERRTVFFTLLRREFKTVSSRANLFGWLMETYPKLYQTEDDQQCTILATAAQKSQEWFIEFFITKYPVQAAALVKSRKKLIHRLLPLIMWMDCSKLLFDHLVKETVLTTDQSGNTVLHVVAGYDLEYENVLEEGKRQHKDQNPAYPNLRLELIQQLLQLCPEALTVTNADRKSPYQYRIETYLDVIEVQAHSDHDGFNPEHKNLHLEPNKLPLQQENPTLDQQEAVPDRSVLPLRDDEIAWFLKDKIMHLGNAMK